MRGELHRFRYVSSWCQLLPTGGGEGFVQQGSPQSERDAALLLLPAPFVLKYRLPVETQAKHPAGKSKEEKTLIGTLLLKPSAVAAVAQRSAV